ncbi:hypothetical protein M885DRAFT_521065 [Pelagophyceae sp. CCMP2097]|nr:hypothetical protein M885DRAFT_521065 [Pelagophyceae sp. CCMP2097]
MACLRKHRTRRLALRFCAAALVVCAAAAALRRWKAHAAHRDRQNAMCEPFLDAAGGADHGASLSAFAATAVLVNCFARVGDVHRYLELGAGTNATLARVRMRHKVGVDATFPQSWRGAGLEFFSAHPEAQFDVIVLSEATADGYDDLPRLRATIDAALRALSPRGLLLLPRAAPVEDDGAAAWRAAVLLRARYDVDVRVCEAWAGGVAVVRRRMTTSPMPLEDLPNSAIAALEWNPRGDAPELIFYELFESKTAKQRVLATLDFGALMAWALDVEDATKLFGTRVEAKADAARWRRTCAAQLDARRLSAAASCFKSLLQGGDSQRRNAATLVPQALLLAARGDVDAAAALLRAAVRADPELAAHVLTEAAAAAATEL